MLFRTTCASAAPQWAIHYCWQKGAILFGCVSTRSIILCHFAKKNLLHRLSSAVPLSECTVEKMELTVLRMMQAAGIRGESLFRYYFFLKSVGRRFSRLNRGLLAPKDLARLAHSACRIWEGWLRDMPDNRAVQPPLGLPSSVTLVTESSMQGWDGLLLKDAGEVLAAELVFFQGAVRRSPTPSEWTTPRR